MANSQNSVSQILNVGEPKNTLTMVTFPAQLKLSSTNYLGWKTQIEALLHGLDLYKFIDGTNPAPAPVIGTDGKSSPHKDYDTWFRQDRLLFGALVGTLSQPIIPLVTHASSSYDAWKILSTTYASPSRGHIKQLQYRLKQCTKAPNQSVTDYMQAIKTIVDELAILGKKMDDEDITDTILAGLDSTMYKPILDAMNARDTSISFNELHEKLINHELSLAQSTSSAASVGLHQPATVFLNQTRSNNKPWNNKFTNKNTTSNGLLPTPMTGGSRPYLGKCQWCHIKGHSLTNCEAFKKVHPNISIPSFNQNISQPQVNMMGVPDQLSSSKWLFDSGASHHVTNDLNNLSLHAPYDGTEELVIGDGPKVENSTSHGCRQPGNI